LGLRDFLSRGQDSNGTNAARVSAAGEGWTEPNLYFRHRRKCKSSPVIRTISSVHNGLKLWTLDFYVLMYEQAVCLLIFYALLVTYSTATPLRVSAV